MGNDPTAREGRAPQPPSLILGVNFHPGTPHIQALADTPPSLSLHFLCVGFRTPQHFYRIHPSILPGDTPCKQLFCRPSKKRESSVRLSRAPTQNLAPPPPCFPTSRPSTGAINQSEGRDAGGCTGTSLAVPPSLLGHTAARRWEPVWGGRQFDMPAKCQTGLPRQPMLRP